ncbi:MAG TPA: flagellar biosynthetic protein FliO [Conexibacter sp.]|nr:flagellar biosynthetic protein FliO [Conexibacter sp.]
MNQASLLTRVAATVAAVALLLAVPAPAFAAGASAGAGSVAGPSAPPGAAEEATPIDFTGASDPGATQVGGGGGSLVRTIVGLAIVIGVIYGVAWVLRQVKASRQPRATGSGLAALASVPLGSGRSVQLVRAGTELVLLGVAEQGVVPIRTYTEQEARAAGLVDDDGMLILPAEESAPRKVRPRLALPAALSPAAIANARKAALSRGAADAPRPKLALPAGGRGARSAVDTLRSWTVRG